MNLRSFAIGMRIDQWLADDHPELRALQAQGIEALQQENLARCSPTGCWAPARTPSRTGPPARWTRGPSCWPSSTGCRPAPRTTASWSTPGPPPSA